MENKFYTSLFGRIAKEKQRKIVDVAIQEFANKGFNNANINIIAQNADVSVGSLYKYFITKENLFLGIATWSISRFDTALDEVAAMDLGFYEKIETFFRVMIDHAKRHPNFHRLYNELTSEGYSEMIKQVSMSIESLTAKSLKYFISQGKEEGIINSESDTNYLSWVFGDILLLLHFSYACDYYRDRFKVYLGDDVFDDDEKVIANLLALIRKLVA